MTDNDILGCVSIRGRCVEDNFLAPDRKINFTGTSVWSLWVTCKGLHFRTDFMQGAAYRHYRHSNKRIEFKGNYTIDEYTALRASEPIMPNVLDVMAALAMDAESVEHSDFDDWCSEFGYSNDSIKAKNAYITCCETRGRLNRLFDLDELYNWARFRDI